MRVLMLTNMYPHAEDPSYGSFVHQQAEALRAAGAEVDTLFVNGRVSRWRYLAGYPRFWARIATRRYDLVHAHYVFSGWIARAQLHLPIVQSFHAPGLMHTWQGWLCRRLHPLVDSVIATNPEHVASLGCTRANVVPCGVNLELFQPGPRAEARARLGWPQAPRIVLWAGDPRPEKRLDLVHATFERLRATHPDLELRIVTRLDHDRLPDVMNASDLFLFPSAHEGSPVVVKEAMACNLCIVATRVGDLPTVLAGVHGCRLADGSVDALAAAAAELLAEGGRSAGRAAVAHLSTTEEARRILAIYEAVLARRRASQPARAREPHAGHGPG